MPQGRTKPLGERCRMIFDLPDDIQMAIRLRAVKYHLTTAQVLSAAICAVYAEEIEQAQRAIRELTKKEK